MTVAIALTLLAAGTWLLRVLFITMLSPAALPAPVRAGLDYVGPAVLAGLVVTILAGGQSLADISMPASEVTALIIAGLVALRGATLLTTVSVAMAVLWTVELLVRI